ncbi:hypothetical protein KL905_000078 [Ogataea polymorpha]|nr:hypothetical protein KL937_001000 [Ogataea polymorpha]KAG7902677.1 hypothetical protein KL935_001585 [Ogataea polymorpha]KAG7911335.1 hypothetical protein KL906_000656 [Ogataea polymorpha]KAG7912832.1 hypothetical protein KL907_001034 [Ogataea polymorpha]KAG7919447.1 hypothetical protein KL927_001576 [Ogataea polymorpha]
MSGPMSGPGREKDSRDGSLRLGHGRVPSTALGSPALLYGAVSDSDGSRSMGSAGMSRHVVRVRESPVLTLSQKAAYYLPCSSWLPAYGLDLFVHDVVAGLSLASYQIPLSMSFANAVAHVPPVCGLLGLSLAPAVYAVLGTVPQMIVGPEAAVSMIIGQAIEKVVKHNDGVNPVDILVVITSFSGVILLVFGLLRFGFIDNVLCGTLLRGFVAAIGLTMIVNSTIAILGIDTVLLLLPPDEHVHSAAEKVRFIWQHGHQYHAATLAVGTAALFVLLAASTLKKTIARRHVRAASFFPEILFVVVLSTVLSAHFRFDKKGIRVLGKVDIDEFQFTVPFRSELRQWYPQLFSTSFMCAILGFFESSSAGKSLGSSLPMPVSSNRELVALGTAGLVLSFVGSLPSFGGYGRSRLNSFMGAKTPVAGLVMGLATLLVTTCLLSYVYYLPLCVLNAIIATVGLTLVQETPRDVRFHLRTRGYNELATFVVTLVASLVYSIELGVALGCFYSVVRVIKHSTKSRIQILSRVAGTDEFVSSDFDENAVGRSDTTTYPCEEIVPGYSEYRRQSCAGQSVPTKPSLEDREACLIVRVPEPLTFTNTNDLKARLRRLELCGSVSVHPAAQKNDRPIRHVVFDLDGMTSVDSSAVQILRDVIVAYQRRGINVFFCRVFKSAKLLDRLQLSGIAALLQTTQGSEFGIAQNSPPYYDEILDALRAVDTVETACTLAEEQSLVSYYDGL